MKKIVLYGDSIAAGSWRGSASDMLDKKIVHEMKLQGLSDYEIVNLGVPGASTTSALENVAKAVSEHPDILVLNVGINDAISILNNISEYATNINAILEAFPTSQIIVLGPSYVDDLKKPQAIQAIILEYNKAIAQVAIDNQCHFIDIYELETREGNPNIFLQEDGLHPSEFGYEMIANRIVATIATL
ncbi:SGNH/GDSL hydrolase family protein [Erysipelothrix sp. HDW6C]|uniref:SGNH/GDSL hydrolase family protein n=1 Tax=Erysipelothrix sp. HDW6C TaxID=2714930 RepID=UPI00140827A2|nr:SGNH/GDSL hydrolase family protein [Erysipelothrix sp. HDW6C]QIK69306.1 SGNH/GDSL hydrolase family protein [Erysipelothrix sp. HDW6C]